MACDNCEGLTGFWCPICSSKDYPRGPLDKVAEQAAENARLRAELKAANARIATVRQLVTRGLADHTPGYSFDCQTAETAVIALEELDEMLNGKEAQHGD